MQTRTVEQVESWNSRPFSGGYAALHELADAQFSGAVTVGGTWLFLTNGRAVGVFEGGLSDFENGDGTQYEAPSEALPLLFSMQQTSGETRANYYTNDTPISEVDQTLTDSGFAGYVELSENVLSGDYYLVYYGGRSMPVAFIGSSERLETGDEAFERANDEVGIYEVTKVDLEVIDLPEPPAETSGSTGGDVTLDPEPAQTEPEPEPEPEPSTAAVAESEPAAGVEADAGDGAEAPDGGATTAAGGTQAAAPSQASESEPSSTIQEAADALIESEEGVGVDRESGDEREAFAEEQQWRESKAIPSLDPDRTDETSTANRQSKRTQTGTTGQTTASTSSTDTSGSSAPDTDGDAGQAELKAALVESKREIEQLREKLAESRSAHDDIDDGHEELQAEISRLRSKLKSARDDAASASTQAPSTAGGGSQQFSGDQALAGTNLFVRYSSQGKVTLEDAHANNASREAVNANLQLEHHTQFDAGSVTIDGQPYDEFLRNAVEYQFVEWVVQDLLYEIRDTGHQAGLKDLYNVFPRIDRAELFGSVDYERTEDGERVQDEQSFDVIFRDRMGTPLLVADINDSRDPASGQMMSTLVESSNAVTQSNNDISAAFFVTSSFFDPEALEAASEATSAGLLRREKKESFVRLSRKQGYHLCLIETRAGEFHVNVPEL